MNKYLKSIFNFIRTFIILEALGTLFIFSVTGMTGENLINYSIRLAAFIFVFLVFLVFCAYIYFQKEQTENESKN